MINTFGQYLKALRKKKGLTLAQAERKGKLRYSYLYQIENISRGIPTLQTLVKLAKTYDISIYVLVDEAIKTLEED